MFLVLDIGTSDIKCGCIDSKNNIIARYHKKFPMEKTGSSVEIDFDLFFRTTGDLIKECLSDEAVKRASVKALLITSQAQTFAPVDADFIPLEKGIVWLDERAEEQAAYLAKRLPDFASTAGFLRPIPALYVSKLLWLKQQKPEIFNKAGAFPLINEYLVYKLTGAFYSDSVNFGMSGMYDYSRGTFNNDILKILGLTGGHFPEVEKAAARGEYISKQIRDEWKLKYAFPVFLCGNDQGASACGAGLEKPGDININFGTAMVIYTITDTLTAKLTESQIAGKHPMGDDYFLLNLENDYGIQIRKLKNIFFKNGTYDELFQTYLKYPEVDANKPLLQDVGIDSFSSVEDMQRYCSTVIKYYLSRLKIHLEQIRQAVTIKNITLSGGMMKSQIWYNILQEFLNRPLTLNNRAGAGMFGALNIYMNRKSEKK